MILCGLVTWGCVALALGVAIGKAIHRADTIENRQRADTIARHPSVRGLSDAEVQRRIRQLEREWTA